MRRRRRTLLALACGSAPAQPAARPRATTEHPNRPVKRAAPSWSSTAQALNEAREPREIIAQQLANLRIDELAFRVEDSSGLRHVERLAVPWVQAQGAKHRQPGSLRETCSTGTWRGPDHAHWFASEHACDVLTRPRQPV